MTQKATVLYIIDSLRRGGAERQFVELLKNIDTNLVDPVVVYLKHEDKSYIDELKNQGIEPILIQRSWKGDISPVLGLYKLIELRKVTLIHSVLNMSGIFGTIAAKLSGVPHVCSVIREARDPNWKLMVIRKSLAYAVDAYVANTKTGLDNRFKNWRDNFYVVYNGFDVSRFSNNKAYGLASDKIFMMGMVASLSDYKDHLTLLRAICLLRDKFEVDGIDLEYKLLLIGDGENRASLESFVSANKLENIVSFTGQIADVERIYADLDIAILLTNASLHAEGISNSLVEAMACGIPVIATGDGGTVEFVKSEKNGILINNADSVACANALERLLLDSELRYQLGQNGHQTVMDKFSMDKYVASYLNLYKKLLPSHF